MSYNDWFIPLSWLTPPKLIYPSQSIHHISLLSLTDPPLTTTWGHWHITRKKTVHITKTSCYHTSLFHFKSDRISNHQVIKLEKKKTMPCPLSFQWNRNSDKKIYQISSRSWAKWDSGCFVFVLYVVVVTHLR